jgi:hypothetical protein
MRNHKLMQLLVTAGLVLGLTGTATAATFNSGNSPMGFGLGGLPQSLFLATGGTTSVTTANRGNNGSLTWNQVGHKLWMDNTVWSTVNFGPGTSLFTGVPLISNLKLTAVNKGGATATSIAGLTIGHFEDGFTSPIPPTLPFGTATTMVGPTFGGYARLTGQIVIKTAIGGIPTNLVHLGGEFGETTMVTLGIFPITATGAPWMTNAVVISQVTSNIITIPARAPCWPGCVTPATGTRVQGVAFTLNVDVAGGESQMTLSTLGWLSIPPGTVPLENNTVTIAGTNNLLSGSQAGKVTVVTPFYVDTSGLAGTIPGKLTMTFEFVPEPGTVLLLVAGAAGLAVLGRRRMRNMRK